MKNPENTRPLTSADIYFVFFRHKWKILACLGAGICAAIAVFALKPPLYTSEAKIYIRYILDSQFPDGAAYGRQVRQPDAEGANIINSEADILKSFDLAQQVADIIGPENVLPKNKIGNSSSNRYDAALLIEKNLIVEVPVRSDVVRIVFQHANPQIAQLVLKELLAAYFQKHAEIHRVAGPFNNLQAEQAYAGQISKIKQDMFDAEIELAGRQAALNELRKLFPAHTNSVSTNLDIPQEKMNEYRSVSAQLESYRAKEQELLGEFTEQSAMVVNIREQIKATYERQKKLEQDYLRLANIEIPTSQPETFTADVLSEVTRITELNARLKALNSQLEKMQDEAKHINDLKPASSQTAKKDAAEANAQKIWNIGIVESPTPPLREFTKLFKLLALIVIGGAGGGVGLAFATEFFLDQTVKRSDDIKNLQMPLLLSIPDAARNGYASRQSILDASDFEKTSSTPALWDSSHGLRPFYEALRDQLMLNFEIRNLTHKPKLVAVTGCANGAGASTIAIGLAATLSETSDGNVLLVDMTSDKGAAHPFYRGVPICKLADALEEKRRNGALVQKNLYVVAGGKNGDQLPFALPKSFATFVPKFKASDYDYIIFDLPPVSQISITPRLARFMDMVLLVVESEKSHRDAVQNAGLMLSESRTEFGTILNKTRRYVPHQLQPEI